MTQGESAAIYREAPGGADLLSWFGQTPTFHDAEILDLHLRRDLPSLLRVHCWINTGRIDEDRYFILDKHAIVTFALEGVMDLRLEGFSAQNVIGGLVL